MLGVVRGFTLFYITFLFEIFSFPYKKVTEKRVTRVTTPNKDDAKGTKMNLSLKVIQHERRVKCPIRIRWSF